MVEKGRKGGEREREIQKDRERERGKTGEGERERKKEGEGEIKLNTHKFEEWKVFPTGFTQNLTSTFSIFKRYQQ